MFISNAVLPEAVCSILRSSPEINKGFEFKEQELSAKQKAFLIHTFSEKIVVKKASQGSASQYNLLP